MDDEKQTVVHIRPQGHQNSRSVNLEKLEERELWYKLVVKIISWSDSDLHSSQVDKITKKEWTEYYAHTLKINVIRGREKTLQKLAETKAIIEKNGGFA